ncbi:MAG: hypothetical protein CMP22_07620 [Rickettsiales bacterium]|nr:hypothetical protein [Rickettsiales bacterium]|tara:strand:+ start:280 stop:657 length:378 start_codon:yes stop_codon:yes gene_type:complete
MELKNLPELATPKEVAQALRLKSERFVKELCNRGEISHCRVGRSFLIPRESVIQYLKGVKICQNKIEERGSSGEKAVGTSYGSKKDSLRGSQRAQMIVEKLKKGSLNSCLNNQGNTQGQVIHLNA